MAIVWPRKGEERTGEGMGRGDEKGRENMPTLFSKSQCRCIFAEKSHWGNMNDRNDFVCLSVCLLYHQVKPT